MPWPQPGVWGGPSSLGVRAANSLYWLDATADEGAAGRPEVQEGQAGRSGQSGLATGTENRKETNRVKIGRERGRAKQWGVGRGRRARKSWVGDTEASWGAPTLGDRKAPEQGFDAADAAGERKGMEGEEGSLALGEVKGEGVLPRPQSRGENRGRERREVPERQGRATRPFRTQNTQVAPRKAQAGRTPEGD